ncbi:PspA/IM30 family protein [Stomatohabitans albus]|uniref:PspA/IM30 family protein n=1 Tax=Stomatohabitans albus TaxID=3110766 RepID=UPI00300D9643
MFETIKKWFNYLFASANSAFEANADPKVQLEQAMAEARHQHQTLRNQAATVIANQKQIEAKLNRKIDEVEKTTASARQAVLMADKAAAEGDEAKAADYTEAAQAFATKLVALEGEVDSLKQLSLDSARASDQAKAAVTEHGQKMQERLAQQQKLLSKIDQAKMQETVNDAMQTLTVTAGIEGPSFDELEAKIEARYARARGYQELDAASPEGRMLEVERAAMASQATNKLDEIRAQLGMGAADEKQLEADKAKELDPSATASESVTEVIDVEESEA